MTQPTPHTSSISSATAEHSKKNLWSRLLRIYAYFTTAPSLWVYAVVATLLGALSEAGVPALLKPLLDDGFSKGTLPIWMVPVGILFMFFTRGAANFAGRYILARIANDGMLQLRRELFDRVQEADLNLFSKENASSLSNTMVYEVQTGSTVLVGAILGLLRDSFTVVALLGYLLYLNWKLTMIVLVLAPGMSWVMRKLSKRLYSLTKSSQQATDELAYVVEENVLAHRVVRLHGAQQQQSSRFYDLSVRLRRLALKSTVAHATVSPLTQTVAAVALSGVISIALWQAQSMQGAERVVTVGSFTAFVAAMIMLVTPTKRLADVLNPIIRGVVALERGLDMLDTVQPEPQPEALSVEDVPKQARGTIAFNAVHVRYAVVPNTTPHKQGIETAENTDDVAVSETEHTALQNISLNIAAGEVVAFVGASGAGKTTLVNLLPRFVLPTQGDILLDDISVSQWPLSHLRKQIALVSQDVIMLNQSVADNVALGGEFDRAQIQHALEAANLAEHIDQLPQGMDTLVGHNATRLSGGQRQRLAIARAIYKDAPVLLLDEATSALDNESERLVQEALQRLMQGRTTLIVAHRLSTIEHADRVVVMEAGRIVEQGSHTQLLQQGGVYARLHSHNGMWQT